MNCIYQDREGNRWVGTQNGGLHRFKRRWFRVCRNREGLPDQTVLSVSSDLAGRVYTAARDGKVYQVKGERMVHLGLSTAQTVLADSAGGLWGGWFGGGLAHYQRAGGAWQRIETRQDDLFNRCTAMAEDHKGRIWFGGSFGTGCYDHGRFVNVVRELGLPASWTRALACASDDTVWLGVLDSGLYSIRDGKVRVYQHLGEWPADGILSLFVGSGGSLWIGTMGRGLFRLKGGEFTRYNPSAGLAEDLICGIIEDNAGGLWLASFHGIIRVPRRELNAFAEGRQVTIHWFVYDQSDGLASAECTAQSQPSVCKTPDGRLWFATLRGLAVVDPAQIELNSTTPPVAIEEVRVDDVPYPVPPAGSTSSEAISIPPGAQRIEIHYAGLSFVSSDQVRFQYWLQGHEKGWVNAGARRTAYYTRVPPGAYLFRIRAANNDGLWNVKGISLALRVRPQFWQTGWFAVVAGLAGVALVAAVARHFAVQKLRRQLPPA